MFPVVIVVVDDDVCVAVVVDDHDICVAVVVVDDFDGNRNG